MSTQTILPERSQKGFKQWLLKGRVEEIASDLRARRRRKPER
jgi:hypothetical protein